MPVKLAPSNMYGHWTHCEPKVCEFQHGQTMIYVCYDAERSMESRLAVAQASIDAVFDEVDGALGFARKVLETRNPEFWQNASRLQQMQSAPVLLAVRYSLGREYPVYEVLWNPLFEPDAGVALAADGTQEDVHVTRTPDDHFVYVERLGAQQYAHVARADIVGHS
jgi:hypothetical protein